MKRRLSLAVAFVGGSKVVFLDEPTTGLDPTSRRQIWAIINRFGAARALVLTTHDMVEADLLCNRVAIMVDGELRCLGSQQRLKNLHGKGYSLQINFSLANEECAKRFIADVLPDAGVVYEYSGQVTYRVPQQGTPLRLSALFETMHQQSGAAGITDWGLGQVGLEDVFHHIVAQASATWVPARKDRKPTDVE